jgi:membrane-associated phospholipid phosphatase
VLVPPGNVTRDVSIGVAGLAVLALCGVLASNGRVGDVERAVFDAINGLPGWLYPVLYPLQQLGNLVAGPVIAVLALALRRWRVALAVLAVSFVDLEGTIKSLVVRRRPGSTVPDAVLRGDVPVDGQSFPSGHAVLVASIAVIVTPHLRGRWRLVPWLLVAGVCIGRVYVGAHNPLDVVGGVGLGLAIGAVASIIVHVLLPFRRPIATASLTAGPDQRPL